MTDAARGEMLQLPSQGRLRRYLRAVDWKEVSYKERALTIFSKNIADDVVEIVLSDKSGIDGRESIIHAIRVLSDIEDHSFVEIANRIRLFSIDAVEAILPSMHVYLESINLAVAEEIVVLMRSLVVRAASHEMSRRGGAVEDEFNVFLQSCKFAHTFYGSFGFRLETIVGPNDDPQASPFPFERLVTQRLARGLRNIDDAVISNSLETLMLKTEEGFGSAEYAALTTFLERTKVETVRFGVRFGRCWQVAGDLSAHSEINLTKRALPFVKAAAEALRPPEETVLLPPTIRGHIVGLSSKHLPGDMLHPEGREITIAAADYLGRETRVRLRISAQQYLEAIQAHLSGIEVEVTGNIRRSGTQLRVDEVRSFIVARSNRIMLPPP